MLPEVCTAIDEDPNDPFGFVRNPAFFTGPAAAPKVQFFQLPPMGIGYCRYSNNDRQFGTEGTIASIIQVAILWAQFPVGDGASYPFSIGDMSYQDGRPMSPHHAHRDGRCVDIRPIRKDRQNDHVVWQEKAYDREETQRLVYAFQANPNFDYIFFNDSHVHGVRPYQGHDNHLHVHFKE